MANDKRLITKQKERAQALPNRFIECRLTGHWWKLMHSFTDRGGAVIMEYKCQRCSTERVDGISPQYGELLTRSYNYAEGYRVKQVTPGERTYSAAALRSETWRRAS